MGLLGEIIFYLKRCENRLHLWQFLFGILEGDGSISGGKKRFGIGFACHKDDTVIRQSLDRLQIKYAVDLSRIRNETGSGIQIDFWLFEVLNNIEVLFENLFRYYPKRRLRFIERLLKQSTVRYIMGEIDRLAPISKKYFSESTLHPDLIKNTLDKLVLELSEESESKNSLY
ncbi:MAG: hypothetical protein ACTSPO_13195 [Candidatus Heimdallarchaeaceae archaeon]